MVSFLFSEVSKLFFDKWCMVPKLLNFLKLNAQDLTVVLQTVLGVSFFVYSSYY